MLDIVGGIFWMFTLAGTLDKEKGQWTYWEAEVAVFLLPWQPPQALAVQKAPPQQAGSQEQVEEQELRSADVK